MKTRIAVVVAFLGLSACRVVEPPPPPDAPRITAFTTDKSRIASGESATLTFTTTGATKVDIIDDRGGSVQLNGDATSGTATVAPRASAFYVLRAIGEGGRDTAFVQIAVNEPLQDVFLLPVPSTVAAGETAQLLWGAAGASTVTLSTNGGAPQTLTGNTGVVAVTPTRTSEYVLNAQGAPGTPALSALAHVTVTPVLTSFTFDAPLGVKAGEVINFAWTSGGATQLVLSEQTFGRLAVITDAASLENGAFPYTLPMTLPNGFALTDGLALHFTLTANSDGASVSRSISTTIGERPAFELLVMPEAVSTAGRLTVQWRTVNANKLVILAGGQPVFETLAGDVARVAEGSVQLPAPSAQTDYTVVASAPNGLEDRQLRTVRVVSLPTIDSFMLTNVVNAGGDTATARWTTSNATRVALRVENGATLSEVTNAAQVANGMATLRPLQTMTLVLEAFNLAGDAARARQTVTVSTPSVTISPDPVLRGDMATLTWNLSSLGVTEVVGLATPGIEVVPNSSNFVDLTTATGVQNLTFADPSDGAEKLTVPAGFQFRMLNQPRSDLWVSVNGFISFTEPAAAMNANVDFTDGGVGTTLIAPLWDDLTFGPNTEVLYGLQSRAGTNEKFLVVQWEKVALAANPAAELTFQAHLYETGQVSFLYKTLGGAVNSATTAVTEGAKNVVRQYAFDGNPTLVVPDLELNFFNAGTADGMETFTAGAAERITFYGRTAQNVLPASALVRSFGAGDVTVTEAMPLPDLSTGSSGQWVELRNNASVAVDFGGLTISSLGSLDGGFLIPDNTFVDAGAYFVIGQSTDPLANGGAPVSLIADDLPLSIPDTVAVTLSGTTLGSLSWDAGTQNESVQPTASVLVASGQTPPTCMRTLTYGPNGALGSPGAANESCIEYSMSSVSGGFIPAPAGTELTLTAQSTTFGELDEGFANVTLPQPFTYFGTPYTTVTVVSNGFLTFSPTARPTGSTFFPGPNTVPAATEPNAVIAVFWDDLDEASGPTKVSAWSAGDRFIISWEHFGFFLTDGDLNFQVHLLNDGTIEYHYGPHSAADPLDADTFDGDGATAWIEPMSGLYAIPYSIGTPTLLPNSGVRFTPR